jgi:hypothetical protein
VDQPGGADHPGSLIHRIEEQVVGDGLVADRDRGCVATHDGDGAHERDRVEVGSDRFEGRGCERDRPGDVQNVGVGDLGGGEHGGGVGPQTQRKARGRVADGVQDRTGRVELDRVPRAESLVQHNPEVVHP